MSATVKLKNFHNAKWDEPIIFELSEPGSRGILLPAVEEGVRAASCGELVPSALRREQPPALPEIAQPQVLRHFLRLSQETMGQDINIDIGLGTCTMKYSPKINEQFVRSPKLTELHPLQDPSTTQGILSILYQFEQLMKEISGMDAFFLPACRRRCRDLLQRGRSEKILRGEGGGAAAHADHYHHPVPSAELRCPRHLRL